MDRVPPPDTPQLEERRPLLTRLRYILPSARRQLLDQLVAKVARGELFPVEAVEAYETETWLLPWRRLRPPAEPTKRLFAAMPTPRE